MHSERSRRTTDLLTLVVLGYAALILFPVVWMATMMVKPEAVMFERPTVWWFTPTLGARRVRPGGRLPLASPDVLSWSRWPARSWSCSSERPPPTPSPASRCGGATISSSFILATRMAPPVCLVIPFYLIYSKLGLIDTYIGLIIAYLTFNLSFYVWVLRSFCRDLPVELEEAAMVEGYPRWQVLRRIVLPLLRPGIVATAVLCFIFAWNEFLFAFMLGGKTVKTLPVAIPTLITTQGVKWGEMAIVGIVALVPILIVVFLLQRHIVRGLTLGAVKG